MEDSAIVLVDIPDLGKHFRNIRKSKGLTQEQAAPMVDLALSTLAGLERGTSPFTSDYIQRFEKAYKVSVKVAIAMNVESFTRLQSIPY